jgi:hypothetical protein
MQTREMNNSSLLQLAEYRPQVKEEVRSGRGSETHAHTTKFPLTVMKHMYSNAPAVIISILPEPFKSAVMNSRLWKWERSQNMETTACLASLFPQDDTQDVSFTIWCGHNDGYFLNNVFGVQREYL